MPAEVDFAVIGGGFAGLMTAIELRRRHADAAIAVFEAERVGFGASGRNAGFLSPLAAPVWLLGAERSAEQAWGAARINAEVHAVARWIGEHVPDCELAPATLALQAQNRVSERALREFVRRVAHVGLAHRIVESRVWPGCSVLEMAAYTLHPYKLVRGLAAHADRIGVQLRERARVLRIEGLRAGGSRVHLEHGVVEAKMVVACTNAYTSSLDLGERVPALVVHGHMAATAPVHGVVRDGDFTVEVNAAQAYHRMHGDRIIYGGVDKLRASTDERARLQAQLAASFPKSPIAAPRNGRAVMIYETWSGQFHATAIGLPIIRTTEDNHALVVNVGYGGTGVALSLACARLAACVASNGTFDSVDDTRLLALIHSTRISVRDSLRAVARIARGVAMPWR
jgi:glycine/D-amino acid oxidase-like deaminating enzyme